MTIGGGIVLFVIGAILAFAVRVEVEAVDLNLVGYILMGAGAVVVILGLVLRATHRNRGIDPLE